MAELQHEVDKLAEAINRLIDRLGNSASDRLFDAVNHLLSEPTAAPSANPPATGSGPVPAPPGGPAPRTALDEWYDPPPLPKPPPAPLPRPMPRVPGGSTGVPAIDLDEPSDSTPQFLPPPLRPPAPTSGGVPPPPKPDKPADDTHSERELLEAINRGVWTLVRDSYANGKAPGSRSPVQGQPQHGTTFGAFQPLVDRFAGTRFGGIANRFGHRIAPHARGVIDRLRGRKTKTTTGGPQPPRGPKNKTRAVPRTVGGPKLPTAVPTGATGAASGAAASAAGGGGTAAGGAAAGAAGGGTAAAGVAVPAIGAVIAVTMALVELAKVAREVAREQENRARELAMVSAPHAQGVAQLDVNRKMREIESGANTADSSTKMLESQDDFEEAIRPFADLVDILKNIIASNVLDHMTTMARLFQPIADAMKFIAENLPGGDEWASEKETEREQNAGFFSNQVQQMVAEDQRRQAEAQAAIARARAAHNGYFGR